MIGVRIHTYNDSKQVKSLILRGEKGSMLISRRNISSLLSMLLVLAATSCSASTEQDVSRSVRSSSLDSYSETFESIETSSSEIEITYEQVGGEKEEPNNYGFDLTFSDDLKVYDYGRKTVNVYWGIREEADLSESFLYDWSKNWYEYESIVSWAVGRPFWYEEAPGESVKCQYTDYDVVKQNIQNVNLLTLNELDEGEVLAETFGRDPNSKILCWEYQVVDFPVEKEMINFNNEGDFTPFLNIQTVRYAQVPAFVDGIPMHFADNNYFYCTYDWPGVIEPSAYYPSSFTEWRLLNPSKSCNIIVKTDKWSTTDVIQADMPIVDPKECLEGIANTLKYQPNTFGNGTMEFSNIWGKEFEVYCMNLTYIALNPHPPKTDGTEGNSESNEQMYLVPAWEVYITCTDPGSKAITYGNLVINAVTGESLFSTTIGQGENEVLYPDMNAI